MADAALLLERALRGFNGVDRATDFAAALGFEPGSGGPVALQVSTGLVPDGAEVRGVWVIAERAGLQVTLVEFREYPAPRLIAACARWIRGGDATVQHLILFADRRYRRVGLASFGLDGALRDVVIDREQPRPTDLEALGEMVARPDEGGIALAARYAHALDRARVSRRFFMDFRAQRARIASAWLGLPRRLTAERQQLALLHLCRLMFLYFLQRQGHLAADPAYLPNLLRDWRRRRRGPTSFHRGVINPLFFGALNTRPEARDVRARRLGALPYLNGGLFERTTLERRFRDLDLPDEVAFAVFDELLERYRFTARDSADDIVGGAFAAGVDPEMLGRVFEGMMAEERRGETGTFFTPPAVVDRLVTRALATHLAPITSDDPARVEMLIRDAASGELNDASSAHLARAARDLRVLDPACGSGAFLLGALSRIAALRAAVDGHDEARVRRDVVARALHGVDVQGDAALLCALRLWLALTVPLAGRPIAPLPNLDRRIRQGDALLDPLDLAMPDVNASRVDRYAATDRDVRRAVRALAPATRRYLGAEPEERARLKRELDRGEAVLARAWLGAIERRLLAEGADLEARADERDLWGETTRGARAAGAALARIRTRRAEIARLRRDLEDARALPFFSFGVHFADAGLHGFDLILSNPPWVRAHRWPAGLVRAVRSRYAVCREPGWQAGTALAGAPRAAAAQVDLSLLFLERALSLLSPAGTLGMLLPAKVIRSLYGGSARRLLMRETRVTSIEDHSLDQRSIFRADSFTTAVVATRAAGDAVTRVSMIRRGRRPLAFTTPQADLPLFPDDAESPWLLAPRRVRAALRAMQAAGAPLGLAHGLRVRRGVFTGANEVLVLQEVRPRLGDAASIRAMGWFARGAGVGGAGVRGEVRDRGRAGVRHGRADPAQQEGLAPDRNRYEALIEGSAIRPLLRGSDVGPWTWRHERWIVWVHGDDGATRPPPRRLRAYLERHAMRLARRSGVRAADPTGALFRVTADALGDKVVWHDLAANLHAAAVPARIRTPFGMLPIVPLNSVYFIPVPARRDALLLSAYLNSTPVRTFARAIAERAKDARFRFFAWTIGALPLPQVWRTGRDADRLVTLAERAHEAGETSHEASREMDVIIAAAYGLDARGARVLETFGRWLG